MARRDSSPNIALFPFLSVLMCSIGAMVVIFVATSLQALESKDQDFWLRVYDKPAGHDDFKDRPFYIHLAANRIIIYFSKDEITTIDTRHPGEVADNPAVQRFVARTSRDRMIRWPVLVVRPSGVPLMREISALLYERGVSAGKYAIGEKQLVEFVPAP